MTFPARLERFAEVDSTQRVVAEWLAAGQAEVAVAVAAHQAGGRGRQGREWVAPLGAGLLLSVGFRPVNLAARHAWRLAAIAALAMRDAAEEAAGLADRTLWLKWPNDLVAEGQGGSLLKVCGVLGESVMSGERVDSATVGIGINTDWRAADFPPELAGAMTSLRELSGGRPIDNDQLLDAFLYRLEPRYEALLSGLFDAGGWSVAQRTTGRRVEVQLADEVVAGSATGVDPESGALLMVGDDNGVARTIDSGEVVHCRLP